MRLRLIVLFVLLLPSPLLLLILAFLHGHCGVALLRTTNRLERLSALFALILGLRLAPIGAQGLLLLLLFHGVLYTGESNGPMPPEPDSRSRSNDDSLRRGANRPAHACATEPTQAVSAPVVAGWISTRFGSPDPGVNLYGLLAAIVGAIALLVIYRRVLRRALLRRA